MGLATQPLIVGHSLEGSSSGLRVSPSPHSSRVEVGQGLQHSPDAKESVLGQCVGGKSGFLQLHWPAFFNSSRGVFLQTGQDTGGASEHHFALTCLLKTNLLQETRQQL